jgi:class 3 adenylate cyclase/tetratricopeptide (TPR) repeat protein
VRCSKCGFENPAGMRFCGQCTTALALVCPKCSFENPPGFKFCGQCMTALTSKPPALRLDTSHAPITVRDSEDSGSLEGERKTVTALFADIKGSMELIENLDPEEARAIVDPALKLMMEAVHHYGGYVAQSTGDGIFAMFGAPVAHEDHPQRALYAALRMQEELKRYSDRIRAKGRPAIQARVGANTGEVVVRSIATGEGRSEYVPVGHSTGIAARMQALAPIGSIATTEQIRKLCEGYFLFRSLGPTNVKGVSEAVNVYEVTGVGPLRTRLQRAAARGYTKFVGREREIQALKQAADLAQQGRGQIVVAMAEPGVGKSRLFYEFKATSASGWLVLEALSISHGKASAYLPVIDLVRNYFEISAADDERKRREKVAGKIAILDRSLEDTLPYLYSLLGIVEGHDPLAQTDSQIKKRRTLEALKRILVRESLNQPLIVIFEDLQWMDGESQALLNLLADAIGTSRVLLLFNYRPEYRHQWGSKTYYTQLRLDPLGKESADEMLSTLLGTEASLAQLKRLIADKTEGNPLFMEEIVLSLFEDGALARNGEVKLAKPLSSLRIPPTVHGIIAARIDRLPADEKDLLQTVAVMGSEFNLAVARELSGIPDDDLSRMLNDLQLAEFIYEQPATGDVRYTFKHALTHDVAYQSLLAERRKLLHQRTGQAIETMYANRLDDHLTELARHFDTGGNVVKAVQYLSRSGSRTAMQGAHSEAIGHFTRALELVGELSGAARDRHEFDLQMALSWSLFVARGRRTPELEHRLVRAQELAEQLGDHARLMAALVALSYQRWSSREFELARELAERVIAMAQQAEAPALLGGAHHALGLVRFDAGQFPEAREHFLRAVELFGTGPSDNYIAYFAQNSPNIALAISIILGYPSTVLTRADELLAAARRSSDPSAIAVQLFSYGMHHLLLRDTRMVAERADELRAIAVEHEMRFNLNAATFFWGWAMAATGRVEEGIAEMGRSMSDPVLVGIASSGLMLSALAEMCGKYGHASEGLDWVAKGLAAVDETGIRLAEAELQRLKGEFLMIKDTGDMGDAECCLRTAIDVARRQSAKLFELRATTSLARLLRDTNRHDEARAMLLEVYNWFTEGFDTADLKEAKALLEELSNSP